ncbi:MAG: hypothetical protein KF810_17000 [Rhizobiaceae bacterium]|nr:hypothetical protein [Rhizobiaceae bacterium]
MTSNPLRRRGERSYYVWIKGRRAETQDRVTGDNKGEAIWKFAKYRNVKTIECDAKWMRGFI